MLENAYNIFKLQHELSDFIKEQRAYNSYEKKCKGFLSKSGHHRFAKRSSRNKKKIATILLSNMKATPERHHWRIPDPDPLLGFTKNRNSINLLNCKTIFLFNVFNNITDKFVTPCLKIYEDTFKSYSI